MTGHLLKSLSVRIACNCAMLAAAASASSETDATVNEPSTPPDSSAASVVVVVGAAGTEEYGRNFEQWAGRWVTAGDAGGANVTTIGQDANPTAADREHLQTVLSHAVETGEQPLWLVLIGHGTFDGREANFNLRGEDVSASEMAEWLAECRRPLAIVNCASASAPFIDRLASSERVVVTATKSGSEANFARFGDSLSQAIADLSADLDKDGQVSLLEAFLLASRQTQDYYDGQRLLATEHALLEDNGDARGVPATFFSGLQPTTQTEGGEAVDGLRAHQWHLVPSEEERRLPPEMRQRRNELELHLAGLRGQKNQLEDDAYYELIEPVLLEIAELYASVEQTTTAAPQDDVPANPTSDHSSGSSPAADEPRKSDAAPASDDAPASASR